jgi:hypothetical protein
MGSSLSLTTKEQAVIELIYRFRFLDSSQVQLLLGHKSRSRVKVWLARLSNDGYLQRHYQRTWGKNRNPTIYFLDKKGASFISNNFRVTNPHIKHLQYEERISLVTANHFLSCANFYLKLRSFSRSEGHKLEYYTETDIYRSLHHKLLKPSAYFLHQTGGETRSYFLIADLETASRSTIRKKISRYLNYYQNGYWKNDFNEFPKVLIVCLTEKRKQETSLDINYQLKSHPGTETSFKVSTFNSIEEKGVGEEVFQ